MISIIDQSLMRGALFNALCFQLGGGLGNIGLSAGTDHNQKSKKAYQNSKYFVPNRWSGKHEWKLSKEGIVLFNRLSVHNHEVLCVLTYEQMSKVEESRNIVLDFDVEVPE